MSNTAVDALPCLDAPKLHKMHIQRGYLGPGERFHPPRYLTLSFLYFTPTAAMTSTTYSYLQLHCGTPYINPSIVVIGSAITAHPVCFRYVSFSHAFVDFMVVESGGFALSFTTFFGPCLVSRGCYSIQRQAGSLFTRDKSRSEQIVIGES
jgi:hypothetical protein